MKAVDPALRPNFLQRLHQLLRSAPRWAMVHAKHVARLALAKIRWFPPILFLVFRITALWVGIEDWLRGRARRERLPVPPPLLRHRVHGALRLDSFLEVGKGTSEAIRSLLSSIDRDIYSFQTVLDFGAGCGRVMRFFYDHPSTCRFFGTDIDPEGISWSKKHLDFAEWAVNDPLPPTRYATGTFDLIYAISVFTHLNEEMQFAWLQELKRISAPNGVVLLTVHGEHVQSKLQLPADVRQRLAERGIEFMVNPSQHGRFKLDGLPDFYQSTMHTRAYIDREWSKYFRIASYVDAGMYGWQDAIVLINA